MGPGLWSGMLRRVPHFIPSNPSIQTPTDTIGTEDPCFFMKHHKNEAIHIIFFQGLCSFEFSPFQILHAATGKGLPIYQRTLLYNSRISHIQPVASIFWANYQTPCSLPYGSVVISNSFLLLSPVPWVSLSYCDAELWRKNYRRGENEGVASSQNRWKKRGRARWMSKSSVYTQISIY